MLRLFQDNFTTTHILPVDRQWSYCIIMLCISAPQEFNAPSRCFRLFVSLFQTELVDILLRVGSVGMNVGVVKMFVRKQV